MAAYCHCHHRILFFKIKVKLRSYWSYPLRPLKMVDGTYLLITSLKAFSHQRRAKPFNTFRSKADSLVKTWIVSKSHLWPESHLWPKSHFKISKSIMGQKAAEKSFLDEKPKRINLTQDFLYRNFWAFFLSTYHFWIFSRKKEKKSQWCILKHFCPVMTYWLFDHWKLCNCINLWFWANIKILLS